MKPLPSQLAQSHDPLPGLRRTWLLGVAAGAVAILAGCSSTPPKPVVSNIQVNTVAADDVNPDTRKRPSPVTIRLYALKSAAPFEAADFYSLFEKDSATLGAELVQREEMLLRPGEKKAIAFKLGPEVKAVAVMAAFRDLERSRWRAVHTVDVGKPTDLVVNLSGSQILIQATEGTPEKQPNWFKRKIDQVLQ